MTIPVILMAGGAALAALLWAEYRGHPRLKWIAKPAASAAFVALALACGAAGTDYGRFILTGLVFCLMGDILLIPRSTRTFLAGMAAFAFGHLAYALAFLAIFGGFSGPVLLGALIVAMGVAGSVKWFWPHLGTFKIPVAGYSAIIGAMAMMSLATSHPASTPYWPAALGAVGFAVSDLAVARDQFVKPSFINKLWGLPLYYGAQMLLAASV